MPDQLTPASGAPNDRTLANMIKRAWSGLTRGARGHADGDVRPDLPDDDADRLKAMIVDCLEGRGGQVSARWRAANLGETYLSLNAAGRLRFLRLLVDDFGVDDSALDQATEVMRTAEGPDSRRDAARNLKRALIPARVKLLTQFNGLPEGIKFLVDLRAEVRDALAEAPDLAPLDTDMRELLGAWFDVGLLRLERITWQASAALLEKLAAYEAVHAIRSWQDLKNRLDSDRRYYAFFHPNMPGEPLIFVEVALVSGISDSIQSLLDEGAPADDPASADTAVFYSISNAQRGLDGLSFGEFLIKQVVDDLSRELPQLKTFATLSPLPGFSRWLTAELDHADVEGSPDLLTPAESDAIRDLCDEELGAKALKTVLSGRWYDDAAQRDALEQPLLRLAARYLTSETRANGQPLDPVARFHLANGARIERLNWLADRSVNGLEKSFGVMVNYQYRRGDIEANHEAYRGEGALVASPGVQALAKLPRNSRGSR